MEKAIETDVLIVGSEGAGSRAAIEAVKNGVRVVIVTKGRMAKCGVTMLAGSDVMLDGKSLHEMGYPGDPEDSKDKFFKDIVVEGFYLNNQDLVAIYVRDAPARVKELVDWGMKVIGSEERAIFTTGSEIVKALSGEVKRHDIEILEDTMVTDLLTRDGRVVGAFGVDINTGEFVVFKAKAVVIATGGMHQVYSFSSGTKELTGDGLAMAYRSGAELLNMEMVTFCPNVIMWPPKYRGSIFTYITPARLLNSRGENFIARYPPEVVKIATETEWNKLLISLFTMREVAAGMGSPHGGVYWSTWHLPWKIVEDNIYGSSRLKGWRFQGVDYSELMEMVREGYAIEVAPAAHYFEGGIRVSKDYATTVPGLYAAGECTGGLFGANRVSAATTQVLVEGSIAGKSAAGYAKNANSPKIDERQLENLKGKALQTLKQEKGVNPIELRKRIQKISSENIGVIRDGERLNKALKDFESLMSQDICVESKNREYNLEWIEALQVENMLTLFEILVRSALIRKETRGVHYRSDYPYLNNDVWLKEITVKRVADKMQISTRPAVTTRITPPRGVMTFEDSINHAIKALGS